MISRIIMGRGSMAKEGPVFPKKQKKNQCGELVMRDEAESRGVVSPFRTLLKTITGSLIAQMVKNLSAVQEMWI